MDQPQQPVQPTNPTPPPAQPTPTVPPVQPEQGQTPYKTGDGSYNRESGKKTLAFVGVIIALIAVLSVTSLLLINNKSSVRIQSQTDEQPKTFTVPSITPTTAQPTSSEEAELDTINLDQSEQDLQDLQQDASQL